MTDHHIEIIESREAQVADLRVRRALPTKGRRTVGAWCFVDHMGPMSLSPDRSIDVAPHPHMGLQTVTWLFSGEFLHRDSLGSEQLIRAGQLNLMTSGHGVAHSEENPGLRSGEMHGMQLWVAQPSSTRNGGAGFEHFDALPVVETTNLTATVLVGTFGERRSPARQDSALVGVELDLHGGDATVVLDVTFEYALVVAKGAVLVDDIDAVSYTHLVLHQRHHGVEVLPGRAGLRFHIRMSRLPGSPGFLMTTGKGQVHSD